MEDKRKVSGDKVFVKDSNTPIESPIKNCLDKRKSENNDRFSSNVLIEEEIKNCLNGTTFDSNQKGSWVKTHLEGKEWIWQSGMQRK